MKTRLFPAAFLMLSLAVLIGQPLPDDLQSEIEGLYGSPEGVKKAPAGHLIRDIKAGELYIKTNAADLATGWKLIGSGSGALTNIGSVGHGIPLSSGGSDLKSLTNGANITLTDNGTNISIAAASATPGGSDTQVQFKDGGSFSGDSALLWDKNNNMLTVGSGAAAEVFLRSGNIGLGQNNPLMGLDLNGKALGFGAVTVSPFLADNVSFNPKGSGGDTFISVASDDATPANRTFTLATGQDYGHLVILTVHSNAVQMLNGAAVSGGSGTLKLRGGDWNATNGNSITLIWYPPDWIETGRNNPSGGLAAADIDTSAELDTIVTDDTGSGALVFGTSPTIATPTLTGNITASGLTASRFVTTDGSSVLETSGNSAALAASLSDETGTGVAVFGTSPTISTKLTLSGGTITANDPMFNASQTWNSGGTTFTGMKLNVTDTASASASLLMDLQRGGTSQLSIGKTGRMSWSSGIGLLDNGSEIGLHSGGTVYGRWSTTTFYVGVGLAGGTLNLSGDAILTRDAANVLAQRNGANAQTMRIYSTFTDTSNYERMALTTTAGSGVSLIAETAGTGGDNLNVSLTPAGTGGVVINGGTAIKKVLSAAATLDFDLTAVTEHDLTITVAGAADGDVVALGVPNGSTGTTHTFTGWVSGANTVTIRAIRLSGTPNPASGSFRAMVTQF